MKKILKIISALLGWFLIWLSVLALSEGIMYGNDEMLIWISIFMYLPLGILFRVLSLNMKSNKTRIVKSLEVFFSLIIIRGITLVMAHLSLPSEYIMILTPVLIVGILFLLIGGVMLYITRKIRPYKKFESVLLAKNVDKVDINNIVDKNTDKEHIKAKKEKKIFVVGIIIIVLIFTSATVSRYYKRFIEKKAIESADELLNTLNENNLLNDQQEMNITEDEVTLSSREAINIVEEKTGYQYADTYYWNTGEYETEPELIKVFGSSCWVIPVMNPNTAMYDGELYVNLITSDIYDWEGNIIDDFFILNEKEILRNVEELDKIDEENLYKINRKQEFITRINRVNISIDEEYDKEEILTTTEIIELENERYRGLDSILNEVWKILKNDLPQTEIEILTKEQIKWIEIKEKKATENAKEFQGGSGGDLAYISTLNKETEERTRKLIYVYMIE